MLPVPGPLTATLCIPRLHASPLSGVRQTGPPCRIDKLVCPQDTDFLVAGMSN